MSPTGPTRAATPSVLVLGDVMVDVAVTVEAPFAHASDTPSSVVTGPGGAGANLAAWMARSGAAVSLVGCVGHDPLGVASLEALVAEGVDVSHVRRVDRATGTVVAMVEPDGQRSMLTDRGANLALVPADVERAAEQLAGGGHVHVSGYSLLGSATRDAARRALALAAARGATRSADAGSAGPLAAAGPTRLRGWVDGVDHFFCNLDEGRLLTGLERPADVLAALSSSFAEVVLTLGADGAVATGPTGSATARGATAGVVDTTGAGDGLAATYLVARLRGASVHQALASASDAASRSVAARGARRWRYSRE